MRRSLLLVLALGVVGCVTRVNTPSVRPSYIAAPSGEWQEVLIEYGISTNLPNYRSPELRIADIERVRSRQHSDRKGFLWRRHIANDTVDLRYNFRGNDGWTGTVSAQFVQASDVTTPLRNFINTNSKDDEDLEDRVWRHRAVESTQRLATTSDSADAWVLRYRYEFSAAREIPHTIELSLHRGTHELRLVAVSPTGVKDGGPRSVWGIPRAAGWMIEADGLPFGVVQTHGGGILGGNDTRAWVPSGLSSAERQERLAVMMMLLVHESQAPFRRTH